MIAQWFLTSPSSYVGSLSLHFIFSSKLFVAQAFLRVTSSDLSSLLWTVQPSPKVVTETGAPLYLELHGR